jgi:hypothetical protein
MVSRPGEAGDGGEEGEYEGAAEEEGVDAGSVWQNQGQQLDRDDIKMGGGSILTAAEFAGTTFPEDVMTHPLGIPADEV